MNPDKTFSVDITDIKNVKFSIGKDITPENLADLIVCLGYVYNGIHYTTILEDNGHKDAFERFEKMFASLLTQVVAIKPIKDSSLPAISAIGGLENVRKISGFFPK